MYLCDKKHKIEAVDLFCGIDGLSYGLIKTDIEVKAGIDIDKSCKYPFETNCKYPFIAEDIKEVKQEVIQTNFSICFFIKQIDTSSGGEKFLISLALALGLSDLASNNVSIESLFIDEGFGALDNNTLETVISTLETLHAQGKMIGVISHVESLKERIPSKFKCLKREKEIITSKVILN